MKLYNKGSLDQVVVDSTPHHSHNTNLEDSPSTTMNCIEPKNNIVQPEQEEEVVKKEPTPIRQNSIHIIDGQLLDKEEVASRRSVSFESETAWIRNSNDSSRKRLSDTAWIRNSFRVQKNNAKPKGPQTENAHQDSIHTIDGQLEDSLDLEEKMEEPEQDSPRPNNNNNNKDKSVSFEDETAWNHQDRRKVADTAWIRNSFRIQKKKTSPNNSYNRSVTFATDTMFDSNDDGNNNESSNTNRGRRRESRVAQMRSKLQNSFKSTSNTLEDMDASWGGALLDCSMSSTSSSSDDSEDDDSLGELVGGMDASVNFAARARQSISFNMSFMQIGVEDESMDASSLMNASSRRNTGRGSIFVIADEKFAQTKVVQKRLEKAAMKLQRFFRRCLFILRQFSDEREYLQNEKVDIENRRSEELEDVKRYIEECKAEIQMELEQEYSVDKLTPEEWEAMQKEQEESKQEIARLKEENENLKKDSKELQHKNNQLAIVNPQREAEFRSAERQVKILEADNRQWTRVQTQYSTAVEEAKRRLEAIEENRKSKRAHRKQLEDTICKIIKLLKASKEGEENTRLVEKVEKLKSRRDKKVKKLKAKTVLEQGGSIPKVIQEEHEQDAKMEQEHEQEAKMEEEKMNKQRKEKRKSSRKSRHEAQDGLPDLDGVGDKDGASNSKKSKDRRRSKKPSLDDLPEEIALDPANEIAVEDANPVQDPSAEDNSSKKEDKKKSKDKSKKSSKESSKEISSKESSKDKDKKSSKKDKKKSSSSSSSSKDKDKKKEKKSSSASDEAAKKKAGKTKTIDDEPVQPGALMSLILG